jgi:hypothetical protein
MNNKEGEEVQGTTESRHGREDIGRDNTNGEWERLQSTNNDNKRTVQEILQRGEQVGERR